MAIAQSEEDTRAKAEAKARAKARTRFNQTMKLVRRAHLYAGIFMTPWVFLYGVTALLFNHPRLFPDGTQQQRSIEPADLAGTPLATFPTPQVLASQVVDAINASNPESPSRYQLVRPDEAAFPREYSRSVPGGNVDHLIRLDLATGTGSVRTSTARREPEREAPVPFARTPIKLESAPMEAISQSVAMLLTRFGLPQVPQAEPFNPGGSGRELEERGERRGGGRRGEGGRGAETGEASHRQGSRPSGDADRPSEPRGEERAGNRQHPEGRRQEQAPEPALIANTPGPGGGGGRGGRGVQAGPELNFLMKGEGKVWRVGFNLQTGRLTGRPDDAPQTGEPLSNRRFLLRMHTAHGYPSQWNSRWVWAVVVDIMALCMVGWGITGMLMWWQMKNVRVIGAILIVLSLIVSVVVAMGMHSMIAGGS